MVDPSHKDRVFPPFSYTVERGKLREFTLAIGDENPSYAEGDPLLPPTFPTVFAFWGGVSMETLLSQMGIEIWNVLHSEQEYEYLSPVHIGDTVTGQATIANIYTRAGMDFVEILTEYKNQNDTLVLRDRALLIVRG
jgi:hypothetical protein